MSIGKDVLMRIYYNTDTELYRRFMGRKSLSLWVKLENNIPTYIDVITNEINNE